MDYMQNKNQSLIASDIITDLGDQGLAITNEGMYPEGLNKWQILEAKWLQNRAQAAEEVKAEVVASPEKA